MPSTVFHEPCLRTTHIRHLPDELLVRVLHQLPDGAEIARAAVVCKQFDAVIKDFPWTQAHYPHWLCHVSPPPPEGVTDRFGVHTSSAMLWRQAIASRRAWSLRPRQGAQREAPMIRIDERPFLSAPSLFTCDPATPPERTLANLPWDRRWVGHDECAALGRILLSMGRAPEASFFVHRADAIAQLAERVAHGRTSEIAPLVDTLREWVTPRVLRNVAQRCGWGQSVLVDKGWKTLAEALVRHGNQEGLSFILNGSDGRMRVDAALTAWRGLSAPTADMMRHLVEFFPAEGADACIQAVLAHPPVPHGVPDAAGQLLCCLLLRMPGRWAEFLGAQSVLGGILRRPDFLARGGCYVERDFTPQVATSRSAVAIDQHHIVPAALSLRASCHHLAALHQALDALTELHLHAGGSQAQTSFVAKALLTLNYKHRAKRRGLEETAKYLARHGLRVEALLALRVLPRIVEGGPADDWTLNFDGLSQQKFMRALEVFTVLRGHGIVFTDGPKRRWTQLSREIQASADRHCALMKEVWACPPRGF